VVSTANPVSYGMASAGSAAIFTPAGNCTCTGVVNESAVAPSPKLAVSAETQA
jgi:hypothetical protein